MAVHIETRGVPGVDGDDAITVVTMDRQERRNALEHQTLAELTAAVEGAAGRETRVLILTGAGGHFCSGADLTGVEDASFWQGWTEKVIRHCDLLQVCVPVRTAADALR